MHPIDLPDTPEMRAKVSEDGAYGMKLLGLTGPEVQPWEDGFRTHDIADHSFEWWYFDMQLDDGSTLVATFNTKPAAAADGPLAPSVLIIHRDPEGNTTRENTPLPASAFSSSTDGCDVTIGDSHVAGDLARYELTIRGEKVQADLVIERGCPSWRPGAGVNFFDHAKKHFLAWVVPVPSGTVSGTLRLDGGAPRQVTGAAYHDHNWGNRQMNAGLDHWYWGRAHIGDYTVVYARLTSRGILGAGQIHLPTVMLATSERLLTDDWLPLRLVTSGDVPGPAPEHQPYPTSLEWTWAHDDEHFRMSVTNPRLIESLDMGDQHASWRHRLLHAGEHPWYYDFTADMELDIRVGGVNDTVRGQTLYEKMMLR
jgi:hypothetical protein